MTDQTTKPTQMRLHSCVLAMHKWAKIQENYHKTLADTQSVIRALLLQYEAGAPNHPMTETLREGLLTARAPKRRGGWRARNRGLDN